MGLVRYGGGLARSTNLHVGRGPFAAPGPSLPAGVLYQYDASAATPGIADLTGTGLAVDRAAVATVQTSASTVAAGIPANKGRILYDGVQRGLLIEEARTNYVPNSLSPSSASWTAGGAGSSATPTATLGPDGVAVADRLITPSGTYGRYVTPTIVTGSHVASAWVRESATPGGSFELKTGDNLIARATGGTATSTWARKSVAAVTLTAGQGAYLIAQEGRDESAVGGIAAGARDCLVTRVQLEAGLYPTSGIDNAGTTPITRDQDILYHTGFASWLHAGRLSVYLRLYMQCASTDIGNYLTLFDNDTGGNAAAITSGPSLRYFYIGTTQVGAMTTWARGDVLEFYVAMGGGSTVSRWRCRKNLTGAAVAYGDTGAPTAAISATATRTDILCRAGQTRTCPAALMQLTVYDSTTLPGAWAA